MAEAAPLTIVDLANAESINLAEYDVVGFGSGIYAGSFNKKLVKFIESNIDKLSKVFVFSTSGTGKAEYNDKLVEYFKANGKTVLGSFACTGICKWFIFGLVGGIGKGHPDMDDFAAAQEFIEGVMKDYGQL